MPNFTEDDGFWHFDLNRLLLQTNNQTTIFTFDGVQGYKVTQFDQTQEIKERNLVGFREDLGEFIYEEDFEKSVDEDNPLTSK